MRYPKRAIHLDFHTMPGVDDIASQFDPKHLARTLQQARVDFVTFFAKCNIGFAYYPTKVGIVYPGLKTDMLGGVVRECHKLGIGIMAYFNAGLDHENASRHRDWCVVDADGRAIQENKLNHFARMMCFNGPYGDYLAAMVREVVDKYPVDGVFLDCTQPKYPCYGRECLDEMNRRSIDTQNPAQVAEFARVSKLEYLAGLRKIVGRDRLYYCNGTAFKDEIDFCTHTEVECLPTGEWGYEVFPALGRYARRLGKPTLLMTGRFHKSWSDFGGLRPQASLDFDGYYSAAAGIGCSVGDHMHPRGRLEPAVYERIGKMYSRLAELEPWTGGAVGLAEVAILVPPGAAASADPFNSVGVLGAARMLGELHQQFDVIDADMDFAAYCLLILPDGMTIDKPLAGKLKKFLAGGGRIVSAGSAGLNPERSAFALPAWKIDYRGPSRYEVAYFKPGRSFSAGLPDMAMSIYDAGIDMRAGRDAKSLAKIHKPYFDRHHDGYHAYLYLPPEKSAGLDAVVRSGPIIHFAWPVFGSYFRHAYAAYRTLLANSLSQLLPMPMITADGLPSFARLMLTGKGKKTMAHVLAYCPEIRGAGVPMVEEPVTLRNVTLRLHAKEGGKVSAYLAPSRQPLPVTRDGEYICVTLDEMTGYQVVVFNVRP